MKIYFGCPRAALDQEEVRYRSILQFLKENYDYELSRDWVDRNLSDIRRGRPIPSYELIREEIVRDIDAADLAIFEITKKSMGLGQQIVYTLDQQKPTLILNDLSISRPVRDIFIITKNHQPMVGEYTSREEMIGHIARFVDSHDARRQKRMTVHIDASMHREIDRLAQIEQRTRRDIIEDHIRAHRERTSKK